MRTPCPKRRVKRTTTTTKMKRRKKKRKRRRRATSRLGRRRDAPPPRRRLRRRRQPAPGYPPPPDCPPLKPRRPRLTPTAGSTELARVCQPPPSERRHSVRRRAFCTSTASVPVTVASYPVHTTPPFPVTNRYVITTSPSDMWGLDSGLLHT